MNDYFQEFLDEDADMSALYSLVANEDSAPLDVRVDAFETLLDAAFGPCPTEEQVAQWEREGVFEDDNWEEELSELYT
jgi:hypothetical protein